MALFSSVWHFCGARNADKVDNLNKCILRFIIQDYSSPYDILLKKVNLKSLFIRRLQNFMITLYKSLFFTNYPGYLKDMFTVRPSSYNLRGNHIMSLPNPKTTTYGLQSFSYLAGKIWNSLRHLQNIKFSRIQAGDPQIWSSSTVDLQVIFPS